MPTKERNLYHHAEHQARAYRRLYRGYLACFIVAASLLVAQTLQKAALKEQMEMNYLLFNAAIYSVSYALSAEQAKAGGYEAEAQGNEKALNSNVGYSDNLRKKIDDLSERLKQCIAVTDMVTSEGWTGSASIDPADG